MGMGMLGRSGDEREGGKCTNTLIGDWLLRACGVSLLFIFYSSFLFLHS